MKIIVDADALVAIAKKDDSNNKKAIKLASWYQKESIRISPYTIPEAVTVLSNKVSQETAKEFLLSVRKSGFNELTLNEEITALADQVFVEQTKKGISWFDCLNAALYKHYQMDAIFSFDKFYKRLGLNVLK